MHNGELFRKSAIGKQLDNVDNRNATALFELCPTTLVFGMWDSTGPKGGLGAKFQRAMVSEIVGINATTGVKTSSRIDPAQIMRAAGPLYQLKGGGWTLDESQAAKAKNASIKLGKDGKPSEANHGNVPPSITEGGVTLAKALQTTVISLPALRRLRFPLKGNYAPAVDDAARTTLAALGLCAATLTREQGCDLRSRCHLHAISAYEWELLDKPGGEPQKFALTGEEAIKLFEDAVKAAKEAKLPWMEKELTLTPSPELVALVKKSQELAAASTGGAEEGAE
jgi:CRISPR-associated protein Csb1